MWRRILNLTGVALLASSVAVARFGTVSTFEIAGGVQRTVGAPGWLNLSISAGVYLLQWGPVVIGVLCLYVANRRRH